MFYMKILFFFHLLFYSYKTTYCVKVSKNAVIYIYLKRTRIREETLNLFRIIVNASFWGLNCVLIKLIKTCVFGIIKNRYNYFSVENNSIFMTFVFYHALSKKYICRHIISKCLEWVRNQKYHLLMELSSWTDLVALWNLWLFEAFWYVPPHVACALLQSINKTGYKINIEYIV